MSLFQRVLAAIGLGERAAAPQKVRGVVVGPLPLSQQLQRIGGSLTPQDVSSIIREADTGVMWRLIDLANEARQKDCHLQSVLGTREMALPGLAWKLVLRDGERKKDRKAADFVKDALQNAEGLHDLLAHQAGACYPGYAFSEVVYVKDGAHVVPERFSNLSPRRFEFRETDGRLLWRDQGMVNGVDLIEDFEPGKFIRHQPRINGDVACREGLVRVLMWAALFRNWTIRDWLQLGEIGWKPTRTGKYKKGASEDDIEALNSVLQQLTTNGWASLPETTDVLVEWPKGQTSGQHSTHAEMAAFLGAEMSKAVLGQTLTTEQGSRGALALGKVHENVRRDILEFDARSVAAALNRHLIAPLVRMNFGDSVEIPYLCFATQDTVDLKAFAESLEMMSPLLDIPIEWVRDQAGIPAPTDGDEILKAPVSATPEPADTEEPGDEGGAEEAP